ncbi:hypothetical protein HDU81_003129 [Chytriomyces hyalinus]|nr:hypothetical protein HDU81_003129 [Chytriomyces hyalinus]
MKYHTSMHTNRTIATSADKHSADAYGPGRWRKRKAVEVLDVSEVDTSGSSGSICIDPAVFSNADNYAIKASDTKLQTHLQDSFEAMGRSVEYICCGEHRILSTDSPQYPSRDITDSDADGISSEELAFGSDATNFKSLENLSEHVTNTSVREAVSSDKPSTTFKPCAYTPTAETYSLASAEVVGSALNEEAACMSSGSETFRILQKIAGQDGLNANILKTLIKQGKKELSKRGRFR